MAVIQVIENGSTRCEIYVTKQGTAMLTVGPWMDDAYIGQCIEMDADDLQAFIKMCRSTLRIMQDSEHEQDGNER